MNIKLPAIIALSLGAAGLLIALITGRISTMHAKFDRRSEPGWYWATMCVLLLVSIIFAVILIRP